MKNIPVHTFFTFIILSLILWSNSQSIQATPIAKFSYQGEESIRLNGEWKLFWEQLYQEDSSIINSNNYIKVTTPKTWNGLINYNGDQISPFGYATYYTEIYADKAYNNAALQLPGFYTAQNLYLNGLLLQSNGEVGKSKESSSVNWVPQTVPISLKRGKNTVIIEVSNYYHSKGGFYLDVELGSLTYYSNKNKNGLMIDLFTSGAFFMIGTFFLGMFLIWRKSRIFIIYVILTYSYALRILSSGNHVLKTILPDFGWSPLVMIEYITLYSMALSTALLVSYLFPKKLFTYLSGFLSLNILIVLILPLYWYSQFLSSVIAVSFVFYGYVLVFILLNKQNISTRELYATLVFYALAIPSWIIDFSVHVDIIAPQYILPNLFRLFAVLSLGFLVSDKYTTDFDEAEKLKESAVEQKKIIESQYEAQKTQQLLLKERNEKVETLFREIHHRVKNNLQIISGLLDVQGDSNKSKESYQFLDDSKSRLLTMSLIHQNLYENEDVTSIFLYDYVDQLYEQIKSLYNNDSEVVFYLNIKNIEFDIDTAIPLGLILNELITNAFKYAFNSNSHAELTITLTNNDKGDFKIVVADNGKPLPKPLAKLTETGFGLRLASRLSRQLHGKLSHTYKQGNHFSINFKDLKSRLAVA